MTVHRSQLHEGVPIAIELPARVTLEIVEADPVVKGQTASSSYKPAMLSNGARIMVPPHIGAGTRVVVMTADGSYVERAKDDVGVSLFPAAPSRARIAPASCVGKHAVGADRLGHGATLEKLVGDDAVGVAQADPLTLCLDDVFLQPFPRPH